MSRSMKQLIAGFLLLGICQGLPFGLGSQDNTTSSRLPRHVWPIRYDAKLKPLFDDNNRIDGEVSILMECLEESSNITIHFRDMEILEATLENDDIKIDSAEPDEKNYFYIMYLSENLKVNQQYTLNIKFNGHLGDELSGFYRSSYEYEGQEKKIATTHTEPTDARRIIPCFDEPDFKAVFKMTLCRMSDMTSFENMRKIDTIPDDSDEGWECDEYEDSPKMASYMISLVISEFATKEFDFEHEGNWTLSIHARPSAIENGEADYSGYIAPRILAHYEEFFGIDFPLPKMGMVAMPDFPSGASEMWGLIIYRETRLLFNPELSSAKNKKSLCETVSHELSHQWFGNLVTMKWWDDLWLNEGFASYMAYVGMNHVEPTWRALESVPLFDIQYVMAMDALESSHPISVPVNDPEEINQLFDSISYSKGASIIRMMDGFLTDKTFREGVKNYLNKYKFSNAVKDDLWEELTEQAQEDQILPKDVTVKDIMDTWTLQMGFPVVMVERMEDGTSVKVSQHRFLLVNNDNATSDYSWWVPLTYTNSYEADFTNTKPSEWIPQGIESVVIEDVANDQNDWMIFNIQEIGYYRVNYDEDNWNQLIDEMKSENNIIPAVHRSQLVDDSLNLARAGELDYGVALRLLEYLPLEHDYFPLQSAFTALQYLDLMFQRSSAYESLKHFVRTILDPAYEVIDYQTFEDSDGSYMQDIFKNITIVEQSCYYKNRQCVNKAKDMFNAFVNEYNETNPDDPETQIILDLKDTVYCTALQHGGEDEWDFLWHHYEITKSVTEKEILINVLACSRNVSILSGYLEKILDPESGVRTQDGTRVFKAVANNPIGRMLAWDFLRNNWDEIVEMYGAGIMLLDAFVPAVTEGFNTQLELDELLDFNEETKDNQGAAERSFKQSIETVKMNVNWMEDYSEYVVSLLDEMVLSHR